MYQDPRNKRYYLLQKKDKSQLTQGDIADYVSYCNQMIEYVGSSNKKAKKGWIKLKKELEALRH